MKSVKTATGLYTTSIHKYQAIGDDASHISTFSGTEHCNSTKLNTHHGFGVRDQYVFSTSGKTKHIFLLIYFEKQ